jgi:hypothetical protein
MTRKQFYEERMALFQKGSPGGPGRRKGSRDRIATALLETLATDFEQFGAEAVRIARPVEYLRVIASVVPKELEITAHNSLAQLSDDELDSFIARLRADRAIISRHRRDWPGWPLCRFRQVACCAGQSALIWPDTTRRCRNDHEISLCMRGFTQVL